MYAVIETGGKQYRVEIGTELEVELLDVAPGDAIALDRVLLVADGTDVSIGQPLVADAIVRAEVLRQDRGEKLISFKYRPKARSRVKKGHRQELTVLRVTDVRLGKRSAAEDAQAADAAARAERERLEAAAARQAKVDADLAAKLAESRPADAPTSKAVRRKAAGAGTDEDAAAEDAAAEDAPAAGAAAADEDTGAAAEGVEAPVKATKGRARKATAEPDGEGAAAADEEPAADAAEAAESPKPRKARAKGAKTTGEDA